MLQTLHRFSAYGLIALGGLHTLVSACFGELSADAVWFAGAGMALVFLGMLNLAAEAAASPRVWTLCRVANLAGVAFGGAAAVAVWEIQAYVGLLLLVALALTSFAGRLENSGSPPPAGGGVLGSGALLAVGTVAAGYQLVGCITDGHPWFQVATWAMLTIAFIGTAWLLVRRSRGPGTQGPAQGGRAA